YTTLFRSISTGLLRQNLSVSSPCPQNRRIPIYAGERLRRPIESLTNRKSGAGACAILLIMKIFVDRAEAGRLLAQSLATLELVDPVVLALPRGGVPVAAEVARVLH